MLSELRFLQHPIAKGRKERRKVCIRLTVRPLEKPAYAGFYFLQIDPLENPPNVQDPRSSLDEIQSAPVLNIDFRRKNVNIQKAVRVFGRLSVEAQSEYWQAYGCRNYAAYQFGP